VLGDEIAGIRQSGQQGEEFTHGKTAATGERYCLSWANPSHLGYSIVRPAFRHG